MGKEGERVGWAGMGGWVGGEGGLESGVSGDGWVDGSVDGWAGIGGWVGEVDEVGGGWMGEIYRERDYENEKNDNKIR